MAKLSLSEVSKKFHIDRSTIYRAVRNGRLSRSTDGKFDLAEVIRCFGEPEEIPQKIESSKQESDKYSAKLITHLENEVKKYQEREERLMQQIDRMQTLIEVKSVASSAVSPQQDATSLQQNAKNTQDYEIENNISKSSSTNVAITQQDAVAKDMAMPQHAILKNVILPQSKKRSFFGRVLNAVFNSE